MRKQAQADRADSLDFLRSMLVQLRTMAQSHDYEMVAFLIEMAYLETEDVMRGERPSRIHETY